MTKSADAYDLPAELTVEVDGPLRTVTINRPDELNAVNESLHWALAHVWRQIASDRDARVVILTGRGRTFCAGGDFHWLSSCLDDPAAQDDSLREAALIIDEMIRFPLPVIAAVNGAAVGLGASLAILSDIVLISERAFIADPHVSVGLVAGDGGAAFWPLLTPLLRTKEYLYTGDRIAAKEAVEVGLATRVVEPDHLLEEARALAARMADQPRLALQATKRVINMYLSGPRAGAVQAGLAAESETMKSADYRERLLALAPDASGR